jgi:putative Mn2+ efflux pump MntP
MSFLEIVLLALGLSMDAAAVAAACSASLRKVTGRQVFRFAYHFGLFQAIMPIIGWFVGQKAQAYIETWDHWVAAGLLFFVGAKAIHAAVTPKDEDESIQRNDDPTKGWTLILFSVATSIDALAVGLSLAMVRIDIVTPAIMIGIITAAVTATAMLIGSRIGKTLGSRFEVVGGLVLIGIGIKVLVSHLI